MGEFLNMLGEFVKSIILDLTKSIVIYLFYNWFILPITGFNITILFIFGLILMVNVLFFKPPQVIKFSHIVALLIILGSGYLIKSLFQYLI